MASEVGSVDIKTNIVKMGILRKSKTMKKKWFVLRKESGPGSFPKLEYYDSEKKFSHGIPPKRLIDISKCFTINKKLDSKQRPIISLFTNDDCFSVVCDSEVEQQEWFKMLLLLQTGESCVGGKLPTPTYDHVWDINVKLKTSKSIPDMIGPYRLCLLSTSMTLIRVSNADKVESINFQFRAIRSCGHIDNFFYLDLGRLAPKGPGELWMQTENSGTAKNMHEVIYETMINSHVEEIEPRSRSSSAHESAKPVNILAKRSTVGTSFVNNFLSRTGLNACLRDRSDSMPNRARTVSEGQNSSTNLRKYQISENHAVRPTSSFSVASSPISPASMDSAGSSQSVESDHAFEHSRRLGLTPDCITPVIEENSDEYLSMDVSSNQHKREILGHSSSLNNRWDVHLPIHFESNSLCSSQSFRNSRQNANDFSSPSRSSPHGFDYLPMTPGSTPDLAMSFQSQGSYGHSRGSSLTEEVADSLEDPYYPLHNNILQPCPESEQVNSPSDYMEMNCSLTSISTSVADNSVQVPAFADNFNGKNQDSMQNISSEKKLTSDSQPTLHLGVLSEESRSRAFSLGDRNRCIKERQVQNIENLNPSSRRLSSSWSGTPDCSKQITLGLKNRNSDSNDFVLLDYPLQGKICLRNKNKSSNICGEEKNKNMNVNLSSPGDSGYVDMTFSGTSSNDSKIQIPENYMKMNFLNQFGITVENPKQNLILDKSSDCSQRDYANLEFDAMTRSSDNTSMLHTDECTNENCKSIIDTSDSEKLTFDIINNHLRVTDAEDIHGERRVPSSVSNILGSQQIHEDLIRKLNLSTEIQDDLLNFHVGKEIHKTESAPCAGVFRSKSERFSHQNIHKQMSVPETTTHLSRKRSLSGNGPLLSNIFTCPLEKFTSSQEFESDKYLPLEENIFTANLNEIQGCEQLNYASLDLAPVVAPSEPCRMRNYSADGIPLGERICYSQVDFLRCDGLKNSSADRAHWY